MDWKLILADLSLFDGAGGAAASGAGAGDGGAAGDTTTPVPSTRRAKDNGPMVIYGKQDDDAGAAESGDTVVTPATAEDRQRAYKDFITGDYKDLYQQDIQRIINQRFKQTKELEGKQAKSQPILDMLSQRYGVTDGDMDKLMQAVQGDHAYWQEAADEVGMTVEQYMEMQKLRRENQALLDAKKAQQSREQADRQLAAWTEQERELKALYPSFDINAETQNPRFMQMLRSGVPMQQAYEVIHLDDIKSGVQRATAKAAEKHMADNIRARGNRPAENGSSGNAGFVYKSDVSKLSKTDRANIARQVRAGKTIKF